MKKKHLIPLALLCISALVLFIFSTYKFVTYVSDWAKLAKETTPIVMETYNEAYLNALPIYLLPFIISIVLIGVSIAFILTFKHNIADIIRQEKDYKYMRKTYEANRQKQLRDEQIAKLEQQIEELKKDDR